MKIGNKHEDQYRFYHSIFIISSYPFDWKWYRWVCMHAFKYSNCSSLCVYCVALLWDGGKYCERCNRRSLSNFFKVKSMLNLFDWHCYKTKKVNVRMYRVFEQEKSHKAYILFIYSTKLNICSSRAMAVCISLLFGRLGCVVGANTAALLLENYCETVFYLSGSTVIGKLLI